MRTIWRRLRYLMRANKTWERKQVVPQCASCGSLLDAAIGEGELPPSEHRMIRRACLRCYATWTKEERLHFAFTGNVPRKEAAV